MAESIGDIRKQRRCRLDICTTDEHFDPDRIIAVKEDFDEQWGSDLSVLGLEALEGFEYAEEWEKYLVRNGNHEHDINCEDLDDKLKGKSRGGILWVPQETSVPMCAHSNMIFKWRSLSRSSRLSQNHNQSLS